MSATIRETITAALSAKGVDAENSYYATYVDAVVEALTERDYQIAERVADTVQANTSFSREEIEEYGAGAGLTFRPAPEPEPEMEVEIEFQTEVEVSEDAGTNEKLDAILSALSSLTTRLETVENVARSRGLL